MSLIPVSTVWPFDPIQVYRRHLTRQGQKLLLFPSLDRPTSSAQLNQITLHRFKEK